MAKIPSGTDTDGDALPTLGIYIRVARVVRDPLSRLRFLLRNAIGLVGFGVVLDHPLHASILCCGRGRKSFVQRAVSESNSGCARLASGNGGI